MPEITDQQIATVIEALRTSYSRLRGPDFCQVLGFNPQWDMEYFLEFSTGFRKLTNRLGTDELIKLVRWGLENK